MEKRQQFLDHMQTSTDLSQGEQEKLKKFEKAFDSVFCNLRTHKNNIDRSCWKHILSDLERRYHKSWEEEFQEKENYLKALGKYPEIRDKLQHTQAELTCPDPSQDLQDACRVLQMWKENLDLVDRTFNPPLRERSLAKS
jgi:hypothetical protein